MHYRDNLEDVQKLSSMKVVNGHLVGTLEQNLKGIKLDQDRVA